MIEQASIVILSIGVVGISVTAIALGIRVGGLRALVASQESRVRDERKKAVEISDEFNSYQSKTKSQIESLYDSITDLEDILETCDDIDVIKRNFEFMLQKAANLDGDKSTD